MSGLIFFGVLGLWVWICFALTRWCMRRLRSGWVQFFAAPVLFTALFVLPVTDELIARHQFNALCARGAVLKIDVEGIKGRRVRVVIEPSQIPLVGTAVPILHSHYSLRDNHTTEELASYDTYLVRGGFMSRVTGFPEGGSPWTFDRAGCSPPNEGTQSTRYGFTLIN